MTDRPTRVLICADYLWMGGAEGVTVILANLLHSLGYDVRVAPAVSGTGIHAERFDEGIPVGTGDFPETVQEMLGILHDWHPDIVLCNHSQTSLELCAVHKAPDQLLGVIIHAPIRKYWPMFDKRVRGAVDCYFGVSDEIVRWMERLGLHKGRLAKLRNLVDDRVFKPDGDTMVIDKGDDLLLTYVGRLSHEKCPALIVHAYREARLAGAPIRLAMVGGVDKAAGGPGVKAYHEWTADELRRLDSEIAKCESEGIPAPIMTNEAVKDVASWLRASDALVLASKYEGTPLVALEALACGVPCILPDVGGCSDLLEIVDMEDLGACTPGILYRHRRPHNPPDLFDVVEAFKRFATMRPETGVKMRLAALKRRGEYTTWSAGADVVNGMITAMRDGAQIDVDEVHACAQALVDIPGERASRPVVAITGGLGFIGHHVAAAALRLGLRPLIVDNLATGRVENLRVLGEPVEVMIADVRNREAMLRAFRDAESVVHLAAMTSVPQSFDKPAECIEVNVTGTQAVLAASAGKALVFASSSSVYGDARIVPTPEDTPLAPISPYASSKATAEALVVNAGAVALRFFNVQGPGKNIDSPYASVMPIWERQRAEGLPLTICGDGEQTRDMVHVDDVVRAILAALRWDAGAYNIGRGVPISINDVADAFGDPTVHVDPRPGDIRDSCADISKAVAAGWRPVVDVLQWVREEYGR